MFEFDYFRHLRILYGARFSGLSPYCVTKQDKKDSAETVLNAATTLYIYAKAIESSLYFSLINFKIKSNMINPW